MLGMCLRGAINKSLLSGGCEAMRLQIDKLSIDRLVSVYMLSSYCYYHRYESILPDEDYDKVCRRLLKEYDRIEHQHKAHLCKENLKAGTAFTIKTYPTVVMLVAEEIMAGVREDWN